MSKASKVVIATAVLAGYNLGARLEELAIEDAALFKLVGELGGSLGSIMDMVEKVDQAVGLIQAAAQRDDLQTVVEGLAVVKRVTADLVSDQDKIMEAMYEGMSKEEVQMLALLRAIGVKI
uniref:Uncharacterized protein n=2 Tax=unclassified bacterial viruses TaxID=12333 RepID=A0AAU6VXK3_9VIRU